MATKTTPPQEQESDTPKQSGPHHQRFSWFYDSQFDSRKEFIGTVYDVCRGVETCLEIVMNEQLRRQSAVDDDDENDRALLDPDSTERLLRLATAATKLLSGEADGFITDCNRRHREGKP